MLLRPDPASPEAVLAIGQSAHAWVSGQLARAWGNSVLGSFMPREEVCLGAEQHDVGMAAWDLSPELNAVTGWPRSFMEMDLSTHLALWAAAPDRVLAQSRYAALVVSLHGTKLYGRRDLATVPPEAAAAIAAYLEAERRRQAGLLATLAADPRTAASADAALVARTQALVFAWDGLSLALCHGWSPYVAEDVPAAGEAPASLTLRAAGGAAEAPAGATVTVDPWPFGEPAVRVRCEGRRLEGRYADVAALHVALAAAPWVPLEWELRPVAGV